MRRLALLALLWGCTEVFGGLDRIVAIEVTGAATRSVEEGDTLRLHARAINAAGDSVPDAALWWERVDTTGAALQLDSATGLVTAIGIGDARIRARVERLFSGTIAVTILPAPDRIAPASELHVTVGAGTAASAALSVVVQDLTSVPGDTLASPDKTVHFALSALPPAGAVEEALYLAAVGDTVAGDDPLRLTVTTAAGGEAAVVVRRRTGAVAPDSVAVTAVALTARGDTVPGSPVRFTILFEQQ